MKKVVLLDRDGTVIVDPPDERVTTEAKIQLFSDTISSLEKLAESGFSAILITNQAGIAEGRLTGSDFNRLNAEVVKRVAESGIKILKTYICPHGRNDDCECRKPKPGMILQAAQDFQLDLPNTFVLGDHRSDILAGKAAGTKTILVRTANVQDEAPEADYQANSLSEAADLVIANSYYH